MGRLDSNTHDYWNIISPNYWICIYPLVNVLMIVHKRIDDVHNRINDLADDIKAIREDIRLICE